MYHLLKCDIYGDYGIIEDPVLPDGVNFRTGALIQRTLDEPLRFVTNCDKDNPPREYLEGTYPVWSEAMLRSFQKAGVDNVQAFPAVIVDDERTQEWKGYYAINVLGLIESADLDKSQLVKIAERPNGLPFVGFQKTVVDPAKIRDMPLFRMAESPGQLVVKDQIVKNLGESPDSRGWGITLIDIDEV